MALLIHSPRLHRLRRVRGLQQLIKIHLLVSTTGGTRDLSFINQPPGTALPVSIPPAAGGAPGPALSHVEMAQPCPSSCVSNPCSPPGGCKTACTSSILGVFFERTMSGRTTVDPYRPPHPETSRALLQAPLPGPVLGRAPRGLAPTPPGVSPSLAGTCGGHGHKAAFVLLPRPSSRAVIKRPPAPRHIIKPLLCEACCRERMVCSGPGWSGREGRGAGGVQWGMELLRGWERACGTGQRAAGIRGQRPRAQRASTQGVRAESPTNPEPC